MASSGGLMLPDLGDGNFLRPPWGVFVALVINDIGYAGAGIVSSRFLCHPTLLAPRSYTVCSRSLEVRPTVLSQVMLGQPTDAMIAWRHQEPRLQVATQRNRVIGPPCLGGMSCEARTVVLHKHTIRKRNRRLAGAVRDPVPRYLKILRDLRTQPGGSPGARTMYTLLNPHLLHCKVTASEDRPADRPLAKPYHSPFLRCLRYMAWRRFFGICGDCKRKFGEPRKGLCFDLALHCFLFLF